MRRTLILTTLLLASHLAHAKPHSPWHLDVICENQTVVSDASVWKEEFQIHDTGRWKCKVTTIETTLYGDTQRDLECSYSGLSVHDGIASGAGSKHEARLFIKDGKLGCALLLSYGHRNM